MRLKDKVALVTGAGQGIGWAIALGMAREGAQVVVNDLVESSALRVTQEVRGLGQRSVAIQADVSKLADIRRMFEKVRSEIGRLDVLVNNAGLTGWTRFFEITEENWDRVIDTNLKGTFFCSLEAARIMREQGGGSIVNVSTNCAGLGVRNLVAYAASKGGIHALTKQLAIELAPFKIRVNTFAPGPTNVARNLKDDPNYRKTWGTMVPMGRTAEPEEMVGPAVFMASDDSGYMTGQVLYVDGGWTVCGKIPEGYMDLAALKNT
jgi:glucose 1-dehydrogenase